MISSMNKIEKNGDIAVLYSPGFGAGWSTWNTETREIQERLLTDAEIVQAVLDEAEPEDIEAIVERLFGEDEIYTGGVHQLQIKWIPKGCQFEVTEYDGSESIHIIGERQYFTA